VRRPGPPDLPDRVKKGNYVLPTVFADVDNRMRIAQEEIFGPVACLIPFKDEADAIRLANDIQYGLSSYVWTENIGRAHRVAAAVEAGMCFVNSQNVRDLRQPFGGTKASAAPGAKAAPGATRCFCEPKNVAVCLWAHHIPHWGCAPTADDRDSWASTMQHIALEGRCFVLSSCQHLRRSQFPADQMNNRLPEAPDTVLMRGGSLIIDPLGKVLAGPVYNEDALLTAELDMAIIPQAQMDFDPVGHYARPDVFSLHVNSAAQKAVAFGGALPSFPAEGN
jgi:hypothetical protein